MKKRAAIKLLAASEDLDRLQGILEQLRAKGMRISQAGDTLKKKDIVLAVLSDHFYADEDLKAQLFQQLAIGAETILPLNLGEGPVPGEIMDLLFARNIITAAGREDAQVAERILSAIPEKKNVLPKIFSVAAVILLVAGGLFLWQSIRDKGAEPVIDEEAPAPNPLGITEEELAEIKDVVIIGDRFSYFTYKDYDQYGHWPEIEDFAYEVQEEDGGHWYSTEDGHEFTMARYEDLRFLEQMPNLNMIRMLLVEVEPEALPDLSGSTHLTNVSIRNCSMTDISWIAGSSVSYLDINGTHIADYSPLTDCASLHTVTIDGQGRYDGNFTGFAPPALYELELVSMDVGEELSDLTACERVRRLRLVDLPIQNLDFLKEMPRIEMLDLGNLSQLRDITSIAALKDLRELSIAQADLVRDYTPIQNCSNLERISIDRREWIPVDSSFLNGLTKLRDIGLFGLNLNNMDFLENINPSIGLCLSFAGDIQDYSGLSHVTLYQWLHVNPRNNGGRYGDFSEVQPHIQNANVSEMELYNCTNVDLSQLPSVNHQLTITGGDLEDLTGLNSQYLSTLELRDMQYLRSLNGIEGLSKLESGGMELNLMGCIRLSDYSALDGTSIRKLKLCGMYSLPDFSKFDLRVLHLESIEDMEDLSCLETLKKDSMYEFAFPGLTNLKDLSVLRDYKGSNLFVPPQVADQAEELVQSGNFYHYEVTYPDSGWMPMNEEVTLFSMEELETLPKAVLRRVSRVWIAGEEIIDPNQFEVREEWYGNGPVLVLYDRETGDQRRIETGSIQDFSILADLTNLRELRLFAQPITSLEGIQNLSNLGCFEAMGCRALQDVSALYTLQNLEDISFQNTPVDSIHGVQNLPRLRQVNVGSTHVTDLSPLLECDFSFAEQSGGFCMIAHNTNIEDLSPIAEIPSFSHLNLCGYHPDLWMQYVENAVVRTYCGPMGDDGILRQFVQQHPELEEMHIESGYELTDLTPLLDLPNLRNVHIWDRAEWAARSLDGLQRQFQLGVD